MKYVLALRTALAGVALASMLGGCAASLVRNSVPESQLDNARIELGNNLRFWGNPDQATVKRILTEVIEDIRRSQPGRLNRKNPKADFLALSGGGADGAYGAGFLQGWTQSGQRPQFQVVTGVSTGALIAPFAFLGSKYDDVLEELFTTYQTSDFAQSQILSGLLGGISVADDSGLRTLIERYADRKLLRAIAREHRKGRRLYVATTNIDAQRGVVWDLGAIASRGTQPALALFRKVLLASTSIPGLFPPVEIKVQVDGKQLQELHVDGGLAAQVFFMSPNALTSQTERKLGVRRARRTIYVLRNTRIEPEYKEVKPTTLSISARSVETLIKSQGRNDLLSIYFGAQRNGMAYRLSSVPKDFKETYSEPFDRDYMRALFKRGRLEGRQQRWRTKPPQLDPGRQ